MARSRRTQPLTGNAISECYLAHSTESSNYLSSLALNLAMEYSVAISRNFVHQFSTIWEATLCERSLTLPLREREHPIFPVRRYLYTCLAPCFPSHGAQRA
jgi:hypothetical protein